MPPKRKDVEKEIAKINKEISDLKWSLKNDVLSAKKRQDKKEKISELKKVRKDLTKMIEGWRVKRVTSQKQ